MAICINGSSTHFGNIGVAFSEKEIINTTKRISLFLFFIEEQFYLFYASEKRCRKDYAKFDATNLFYFPFEVHSSSRIGSQ